MFMDSKEEFLKIRTLIFQKLLEANKNSNQIVIERICYSISLLMLIGIVTYWPDCIENIIEYSTQSNENCYISMLILENLNKELGEINLQIKIQHRVIKLLNL